MKLKPSPVLRQVLQGVTDGLFVCYPAGSHHVPGWGWSEGGEVTLGVQQVLSDLHAARLIDVDSTVRDHVNGDPVVVTGAGRVALNRLLEGN